MSGCGPDCNCDTARAQRAAYKDVVVGCVIDMQWHVALPRMLCVQRRANQEFALKWSIPGGKVEQGESLYEAAMREFEEELGIQPQFELYPYKVRMFGGYHLHYLRATSYTGTVQNLDNVPDLRWVTAAMAKTMDFLPDDLCVLRRVLYLCNNQHEYKTITIGGKVVPMYLYCQRQPRHQGYCKAKPVGALEPILW